ncbi:hypothetical protein [Cryobacterium sp. Y29]|uniref:hypothetical protein n=1 Tax=Cryobacterium sp. Y29 TaxID=2048285 RepID=UPI000CE3DA05|nr:hypothetical protein [Cryobacterium sp. Y29]
MHGWSLGSVGLCGCEARVNGRIACEPEGDTQGGKFTDIGVDSRRSAEQTESDGANGDAAAPPHLAAEIQHDHAKARPQGSGPQTGSGRERDTPRVPDVGDNPGQGPTAARTDDGANDGDHGATHAGGAEQHEQQRESGDRVERSQYGRVDKTDIERAESRKRRVH